MYSREAIELGEDDEGRMRTLMAIAPISMLETAADGCISWANKHWEDIVGKHWRETLGRPWFDGVHSDDREWVMEIWRSSGTHSPISFECRLRAGADDCRWVVVQAAQVVDSSRENPTYLVTLLDVTARHRATELSRTTRDLEVWAEQSAAAMAQQSKDLGIFAALVESIGDALAIMEPAGQLRHVNGTFRNWFHVTEGMSWSEFLTALGTDANTETALQQSNSINEPWQDAVTLRSPRFGNFPAEIRSFPIFDALARKLGLAIVIRDMSAYEEAVRERARLNAEIISAQETAIRELSTPLLPIGPGILAMPIVGNVDLARGQRILEVLLSGIHEHRSTVAILDVTGVRQVNADVGNILLQSARAARLLGTKVVLTGVNSLFARTLIDLGFDLNDIKTMATLEQGIQAAFSQTRTHKDTRRMPTYGFSSP